MAYQFPSNPSLGEVYGDYSWNGFAWELTTGSALQPLDNVSELTNDAGYITSAQAPVQSVAGKTGAVTLVKGDVGLANVDNTSDANKPVSTAQQAALDAKADLVGGVIPNSQLPSLAISEYLGTATDETAMLALSGQRGDWAIRTDTGTTWVITTDGGSLLGDWTELATPADAVSSVNGYTGTIVLSASDVGAATTAQGALADSAVQPGDSISSLTNDADYVVDASYVHTDNNYTTTEKTKLSGIESGATADQTASEILTAIKTVDGSDSGLDADTLDGVSWGNVDTNILPASDNTGVIGNSLFTWSNGQFTNLTIDSTLNVRAAIDLADSDILRFGSSDDWEFFHNGTHNYMDLNVGDLYIRDNTTTRFTFSRATGDFAVSGNITASGNTVWHAGNDGTGSGLDADTVDGIEGANFLRSDQSDTMTGALTMQTSDALQPLINSTGAQSDLFFRCGNNSYSTIVFGDQTDTIKGGIRFDSGSNELTLLGYNFSTRFTIDSNGDLYSGTSSGNKIWHAGNDGSASGLDADLLDGLHENTFMRRDANSDLVMNSQALHFGPSNTNSKIRWSGTTSLWDLISGDLYIRDNTTTRFTFERTTGNFTATGNINSNSDIKLKTNIKTISNPLDKVIKLRGVEYNRIDMDNERQIGVIAQEVEKIIPELVGCNEGTKTVSYGNITAILIEAIKEQQKQIEELRSEIEGWNNK